MKFLKLFLMLIVCVLLMTKPALSNEWSEKDINYELAYQVLHFVDWKQTQYITKNCDNYYEKNPILGKCPTIGEVNRYFAITSLLHWGISHWLSDKNRGAWQYFTIGFQTATVSNNFNIGLKVEF